jgi:hypothetical protein
LNWEESWQTPGRRQRGILLLPVLGANYGLPLFAAILSLLAYGLSAPVISGAGWILVAVNVMALIYSLVLGYMVEFQRFEQVFRPRE